MLTRSGNPLANARRPRRVGGGRTILAVVGVALAASTTAVTAASLPLVASARAATAIPPPAAPTSSSSVRLSGQKWSGPHLQRSEAGIAWAVRPRLTLELNYERSALGPTMRNDHDDGILGRLKFGF
ncbi:MAG TPA: hypothetical protein VK688_00185 [Gemmatimonadales bacterium]|nr:hypothetical protein [Gemmatimonadales bacterium]